MNIKPYIPTILLCLLCFVCGCLAGEYYAVRETITVTEKGPVYVKGETVTKTEIVYVPKEKGERADMTADIGKQDFVIRVNGKEQTFEKDEDERYMFDKNKLAMEQTSRIAFDVNVPTVDKTKRWAVGVGLTDDKKAAYSLDFPIGKNERIGGWVYHGDETAVGVKIKF